MDSNKVRRGTSRIAGTGVFAVAKIAAGEVIAAFDGPFYDADYPGWNAELLHHAIQCAPTRFRDSAGIARFVNHCCEPNCGIQGLFDIVAMRDIEPGEEVTWDYEMTEDSDWWRMECRCGSRACRKRIGAYRNLPPDIRLKYKGFVSDWLVSAHVSPRPNRIPGPLPDAQLLNTPQSLSIGQHLHAFETDSLRAGFSRNAADFAHWFESGRLFYATICTPSASQLPTVRALVSVLVADLESCGGFVRGEISEHELEPWTRALSSSEAVLYFSTIICPERMWIPVLYQCLLSDLLEFKQACGLRIPLGLTIACTEQGSKHLTKNGFVPVQGPRQSGHDTFMVMIAASAGSAFWRSILDPLASALSTAASLGVRRGREWGPRRARPVAAETL